MNIAKFKKQWLENEDNNMHSENIVLLAKTFGTKADILEAEDILYQHNKIGYLTDYLLEKRNKLHNKLWPKDLTIH